MFPMIFQSLMGLGKSQCDIPSGTTHGQDCAKIQLSQPHFGISVRMKLTFPKVESWNPSGLPKI